MKNWKSDEMGEIGEMFPTKTENKRKLTGRKYQEERVGRNELCPCGSGKRFKKCCM